MMSKLQHAINHMDMYQWYYHILKEAFLAWKGVGALKIKEIPIRYLDCFI